MSMSNQLTLHYAVPVAEFRRMALFRVLDIVRALRRRLESRTGDFLPRQSVTLLQYQTLESLVSAISSEVEQLQSPAINAENVFVDLANPGHEEVSFKEIEREFAGPRAAITDLTNREGGGLLLLDAFNQLLAFEARYGGTIDKSASDLCRMTADDSHVYFFVTDKGLREIEVDTATVGDQPGDQSELLERQAWKDRREETQFLASVAKILQRIRREGRRPNASESAIVRAAYEVLGQGTAVTIPYRSLGVPGFKQAQTLLFLTDPGDGHLQVTCHRGELFQSGGAAIHIEHIDRDESKDRDSQVIEAYRLPAPINAARVRLHIGPDAACTAFIGRPVFENRAPGSNSYQALRTHYRLDRLKSAHMTASCCTAMFQNGIAECKVAIERMTAIDAIDFMCAVAGNVFRDRRRQYLSAAFNIFTPIFDDRQDHANPQPVTDAVALCKLGIALAVAGGFDKVTWDGAEPRQFPSLPILDRGKAPHLDHNFWVRTVHEAQRNGLTTYVSAGLEPQHMPRAVYAALDGVGIGVKLHYFDAKSGRTGDFDPEVIQAVLKTAQRAQETVLGRAAKLLARMARLAFEGILSDKDEILRSDLLDTLAGVHLPSGSISATEKEKEELIDQLIHLGNESPGAIKASDILSKCSHLGADQLDDVSGLENPLYGQIRRLQQHLARRTGGVESSRNELERKLIRLRGELAGRGIQSIDNLDSEPRR